MSAELKVGNAAPDFHARAVGGKYGAGQDVSLKDLRGRNVVLYFYPKDDTPGCTVQACGLRDAWSDLEGRGEIFGVSVDSPASHEKFIGKHHLPFPLLSDVDHQIVEAYGVWVEKKYVRKKIHGRGTEHLRDRRRRPHLGYFSQSKAGRTCRSLEGSAPGIVARERRSQLRCPLSGACVALRKSGTLKHLYGITEEAPEGENLQAQASQAHEGESPQEAFALQVVTAPRVSNLFGPRPEFAPSGGVGALPGVTLPVRLVGMTLPKQRPTLSVRVLFLPAVVCVIATATLGVCPPAAATPVSPSRPRRSGETRRSRWMIPPARLPRRISLSIRLRSAKLTRWPISWKALVWKKTANSTQRSRFTKKS